MTTSNYQQDLTKLADEIRRYREHLNSQQRVEFDLLWGLDENGCFLTVTDTETLWQRLFGTIRSSTSTKANVHQAVLNDLRLVDTLVNKELLEFPPDSVDTMEPDAKRKFTRSVGKRLLFLFQCDLLPGVSGQILQSKGGRDNVTVKPVSRTASIAGGVALFVLNFGMLFYIFLFALRQTSHRQSAWFQSFILWLIVEILFVSTAIVMVTHILIPSIAMKDVTKIKKRLLDSIRDFHSKVANKRSGEEAGETFNAAKYLFVSTRLAAHHPSVKEAAIIGQFSTPWPKQSYQHIKDVSKSYSKKFSAISRSASLVAMFFLASLLKVPPSLQDMIIHMVTTTTVGYTILLHIELFGIFPVLAFGPFLVLCVIVHFVIQSGKASAKKRLAQLLPAPDSPDSKVRKAAANAAKRQSMSAPTHTIAAHVTRRQSVVQGLAIEKQIRAVREERAVEDLSDSDDVMSVMTSEAREEEEEEDGSSAGDGVSEMSFDFHQLEAELLAEEDWSESDGVTAAAVAAALAAASLPSSPSSALHKLSPRQHHHKHRQLVNDESVSDSVSGSYYTLSEEEL